MIDWLINSFNTISLAATLVVSAVVYTIKLKRKNWNFGEIGLDKIITLLLTVYSLPTAVLLFIASCIDISILVDAPTANISTFIAGIALLYVVCNSVASFLNK